jgi:hypothetical protein
VPPAAAYNATMYILAGLLVAGLAGNWLIRPVHDSRFMRDAGPGTAPAPEIAGAATREALRAAAAPQSGTGSRRWVAVAAAWILVGAPLLWGVLQTIRKAALLFN